MGKKIWIRISQIQDGRGVTILRKFFSKFQKILNDGFPKWPSYTDCGGQPFVWEEKTPHVLARAFGAPLGGYWSSGSDQFWRKKLLTFLFAPSLQHSVGLSLFYPIYYTPNSLFRWIFYSHMSGQDRSDHLPQSQFHSLGNVIDGLLCLCGVLDFGSGPSSLVLGPLFGIWSLSSLLM